MAIRTGIIFCTLLLGSLALPFKDDVDMSIFFVTSEGDASQRIVGGSVAAVGSHPWMVSMTTGGTLRFMHCGGSILSTRTVLTAAHCIDPVRVGNSVNANVRVNAGTNWFQSGGQSLSISGAVMHPQYDGSNIKNDIGTLYTATDIVFSNLVSAVPLAFDHVGAGVASRVAGFGRTGANDPASPQLLELQVPTMDGAACSRDVQIAAANMNVLAPPVDPAVEICTFHSAGRGTCRGDSGSALVRIAGGQQIGIVSWGFPCALGAPDMFVRVSAYQSWLAQNVI